MPPEADQPRSGDTSLEREDGELATEPPPCENCGRGAPIDDQDRFKRARAGSAAGEAGYRFERLCVTCAADPAVVDSWAEHILTPTPEQYEAVIEVSALMRRLAGARAVQNLGTRAVGVMLDGEARATDRWIIDCEASLALEADGLLGEGVWAFCPVVFGSSAEETVVQAGLTLIAQLPPGLLIGLWHRLGSEAVENFESAHRSLVLHTVEREIERSNREVDDPVGGIVGLQGAIEEGMLEATKSLLRQHIAGCHQWKDRLSEGAPPPQEIVTGSGSPPPVEEGDIPGPTKTDGGELPPEDGS